MIARDRKAKANRKWYLKNRISILMRTRKHRVRNNELRRIRYASDPKYRRRRLASFYQYRKWHMAALEDYMRRYNVKRHDEKLRYMVDYGLRNQPKLRAYKVKYRPRANMIKRRRRRSDPVFLITERLRARMFKIIGSPRQYRWNELVGCAPSECREHIEKQFKPGMHWSNRGLWHIDHRRPCASFNLTNPDEQKQCFHFSNLQPLWKTENQIKHAKWKSNI